MIKISKFLQQTNVPPPNDSLGSEANIPILFHYTGFDNLLSIAATEELWATSIHYLNDYEEFKNALTIAKQRIKSSQKNQTQKAIDFLERTYSRVDSIENLNLHIVSFTSNGDLLSQWRAYCPNGGVSVGFRYDDLKMVAEKNNFTVCKCIYEEKAKNEIIQEVVDMHIEFLEKGEDTDLLINGFITVLARVAPSFKNKAFAEEQEWRLVSEPISVSDPNIGVRAKTHMMFPYFRFSLKGLPDKRTKKNLCFDRFIIGPSVNSQLSSNAMGYFLNKYKLSYDHLRYSEVPYRTL